MASLMSVRKLGCKVLTYSQLCAKYSGRHSLRRTYYIVTSKYYQKTHKIYSQKIDCNRIFSEQNNPALRFKSHYENRSSLEYEDLVALIDSGDIYLIDVRDSKDVNEHGGFPGALNIPLPDVKKAFQMSEDEYMEKYGRRKPKPTDTNVVFVSHVSVKSSAALEIAHKLGYVKSRQYLNGFEEWSEKNTSKRSST